MNRLEKINKLEIIRQKYINIRNNILYCKSIIDNRELEHQNKNEPIKKLVLTKPFYGKQIKVE